MISLFGPSFCDTKWAGLKKKFSIHPLWRSVGLGEEGLPWGSSGHLRASFLLVPSLLLSRPLFFPSVKLWKLFLDFERTLDFLSKTWIIHFLNLIFILELIYNVVLVSGMQQGDSVICVSILFQVLFQKESFPDSSVGKESACNAGDLGLIPGLGRSPGEGKGYPLQYSGLENSMD